MPKVVDHDERRQEIVAVTREIILNGGFEAATMRSIAAAAGFANGALKHYFPSKESIVSSVFDSVLADIEGAVSQSSDQTLEGLRGYLEAILPLDEARITAGRVLLALWEYSMSDEQLAMRYRSHISEWQDALVERLAAVRAAGEIKTITKDDDLAAELISVTAGANVLSLMFPMGEMIARYQLYIDSFMQRLQSGVEVANREG